MIFNDLKNVQKAIAYDFKNRDLLQQAFIRKTGIKHNKMDYFEIFLIILRYFE